MVLKNKESIKIKIFKILPWRVQSFLKYRPKGIITYEKMSKSKEFTISKGRKELELAKLNMPFHVENELNENFKKLSIEAFHKHCSDYYCVKIKKAQVLDTHNIVTVIKNNKIVLSLSFDPLHRKSHPSLSIEKYPEVKNLKGKTLLLSTPGAQVNYFHWLLDLSRKIGFTKACNYPIEIFDFILVNKISYSFQKELLNLFGIPMDKIRETEPGSHYNCDELVVPSHTPHSYFGYLFIRDKILSLISKEESKPKRIYISRKYTKGRRIINEPELELFLYAHGFETFFLEQLTVIEQATLFHNTEIIVTPHGAGTANIIFAKPGTSLIEIQVMGFPLNVDFYPYISYSKVNYGYLLAETQKNPADDHWNNQDFIVDISKLNKLFEKMKIEL